MPAPRLRQAMRDAAIHLVAERGMPNVSMSAVAEAAGVSRQTLYNHYADLETVVLDAVRSEIGLARGIIGDVIASAPDAPTALDTFVRGTLAIPARNEASIYGTGIAPEAEGEVMDMLEPIHQLLRGILRRGSKKGLSALTFYDPEDVSEIVFHMIGSGRRLIHLGRDPDHVAAAIAGLILPLGRRST